MKFGVREICDVVLRAKGTVKVGETTFSHDEPVIYFDSAKTSTVEGSATTVYATGGRGNNKLLAWEGEKSVTFTMEDALLSPLGFSILSGAGLVDAAQVEGGMKVHTTLTTVVDVTSGITVNLGDLTGKEIADMIYERHEFLTSWLTSLGVDRAIASEDACKIEHVISAESFEAIKSHVKY